MKLAMRRTLAREGYEQKIRKVGQLISLAKTDRKSTRLNSSH